MRYTHTRERPRAGRVGQVRRHAEREKQRWAALSLTPTSPGLRRERRSVRKLECCCSERPVLKQEVRAPVVVVVVGH